MGTEALVYAAYASLAVSAAGAYKQNQAQQDATDEQKKAQKQQKAINAEQQAKEKRQQIREERIKRARVIQAAENTGTAGSAGEVGSVAGLSTQLGANLGFNAAIGEGMNRISGYSQNAADSMTEASNWGAIGSISNSIFSLTAPSLFKDGAAAGGNMAPVETAQPTWKAG